MRIASTRGPPRGWVGPELWTVGGLGSPIRPYHFLHPRGLFFGSVWGSYHFTPLMKMGRYWPILHAGCFARSGWCSRCCAGTLRVGVPKVWAVFQKVAPEPPPCFIAVWFVALRLDGVVFQKVAPELPP